MNLEESDKFVEKQRQTEQKKKIVLVSIALCAVLIALLLILIIFIQYQDSLKLKMYIDGEEIEIPSKLLKSEGDTQYINIKMFAEMMGYNYTKGEYKKYNENPDSCYIKNNLEIVAMTAEADTLVKYIDVTEGAKELTEKGPYGTKIKVQSKKGDSTIFVLKKPVKLIKDELYLPFENITDVFNLKVDTKTENRIRMYTLPTLFKSAKKTASGMGYKTVSGVYENIRALPYGLIVVGENGLFGVASIEGKKELLSVKYDELKFLQNSQEFFMKADKTIGLLSKEGETIIKPTDYDDIAILDQIHELYLVEKDKKYGVLNRKGEVLLHVDYDRIGLKNINDFEVEDMKSPNLLFEKCIVAQLDGAYGLYDLEGNELLKPVYEGFGCKSKTSGEASVLAVPKEVGVEGLVINFNGLYAIYDIEKQEIVLPAVYSKIYSVTKAGETNYYAKFGEETLLIKDILPAVQEETKDNSSSNSKNSKENTVNENTVSNNTTSEEEEEIEENESEAVIIE